MTEKIRDDYEKQDDKWSRRAEVGPCEVGMKECDVAVLTAFEVQLALQ